MRTSTLTIRGTEYPCCFSTRVLLALEERGKREKPVKSATEMLSSIMENEALSDAFWLLHQLIAMRSWKVWTRRRCSLWTI